MAAPKFSVWNCEKFELSFSAIVISWSSNSKLNSSRNFRFSGPTSRPVRAKERRWVRRPGVRGSPRTLRLQLRAQVCAVRLRHHQRHLLGPQHPQAPDHPGCQGPAHAELLALDRWLCRLVDDDYWRKSQNHRNINRPRGLNSQGGSISTANLLVLTG